MTTITLNELASLAEEWPDDDDGVAKWMAYQKLNLAVQQAFQELRGRGYECYADLLCCQTCARSVMRGDKYVYWHGQDTEDAMEVGVLYLGWAGNGEEIVQAMRCAGLDVEWDGDDNRRILVRHRSDEDQLCAA